MRRYLVDVERLEFDYADGALVSGYQNRFHNVLAARGQDGWEPWHMNAAVIGRIEFIVVWFKKRVDD